MKKTWMVVGLMLLLGTVGRAGAEDQARQGMQVSDMDRDFINQAAQGGMAEVEMGKLAREHAVSKDVREFGQRMVKDHGKANDELMKLAQRRGVNLPAAPNNDQKGMTDKLTKLTGIEFDREYMKHMVEDHEKDVELFQKSARGATDQDLQRWAKKTLPVLEDHLKNARTINNRLKANQAATR